jgi:hypothetical protein
MEDLDKDLINVDETMNRAKNTIKEHEEVQKELNEIEGN